jgi:hypothetical protein
VIKEVNKMLAAINVARQVVHLWGVLALLSLVKQTQ